MPAATSVREGVPKSAAFEDFYAYYGPLVRHILDNETGPMRAYLEDLEQEVWLKVWRHYQSLDPGQNWGAWISVVTKHTAIDFHRKYTALMGQDARIDPEKLAEWLIDPGDEQERVRFEILDDLAPLYAQLDQQDRFMLDLILGEYRFREIEAICSQRFAINPNTVRARAKRLRSHLRIARERAERGEARLFGSGRKKIPPPYKKTPESRQNA